MKGDMWHKASILKLMDDTLQMQCVHESMYIRVCVSCWDNTHWPAFCGQDSQCVPTRSRQEMPAANVCVCVLMFRSAEGGRVEGRNWRVTAELLRSGCAKGAWFFFFPPANKSADTVCCLNRFSILVLQLISTKTRVILCTQSCLYVWISILCRGYFLISISVCNASASVSVYWGLCLLLYLYWYFVIFCMTVFRIKIQELKGNPGNIV